MNLGKAIPDHVLIGERSLDCENFLREAQRKSRAPFKTLFRKIVRPSALSLQSQESLLDLNRPPQQARMNRTSLRRGLVPCCPFLRRTWQKGDEGKFRRNGEGRKEE